MDSQAFFFFRVHLLSKSVSVNMQTEERCARLAVYCGSPEGGASPVAVRKHSDFVLAKTAVANCDAPSNLLANVQLCVIVQHWTLFSTCSLFSVQLV